MSSVSVPYNSEDYELVRHHTLWRPTCEGFLFSSDGDMSTTLEQSLEDAKRIRIDMASTLSAARVIQRMRANHGINLIPEHYDHEDVIGLIGEILAESLLRNPDVKDAIAKWKTTGTSKSRGIDLACRVLLPGSAEILLLLESKHVHREAREVSSLASVLASKLRRGLNEFEEEKVLLNMAVLIVKINRSIAIDRSVGADSAQKRSLRDAIEGRLRHGDYNLLVVVFVDARFLESTLCERTTALVEEPLYVGRRIVSLAVTALENLEENTDRLCEKFAGRD